LIHWRFTEADGTTSEELTRGSASCGRLSGALAAHALALLALSLDGVHNLHERGHHLGNLRRLLHERIGRADGGSKVSGISARAATSLGAIAAGSGIASRALANELALGLGAGDGLLALPVALGGLAHWCADGSWGFALSTAVGW